MRAPAPNKGGRPLTYRSEFAIVAGNMRKAGQPVEAIAIALGVTVRTTWLWRRKFKAFARKMKAKHAHQYRGNFRGKRRN
jgi:hypothetical protein